MVEVAFTKFLEDAGFRKLSVDRALLSSLVNSLGMPILNSAVKVSLSYVLSHVAPGTIIDRNHIILRDPRTLKAFVVIDHEKRVAYVDPNYGGVGASEVNEVLTMLVNAFHTALVTHDTHVLKRMAAYSQERRLLEPPANLRYLHHALRIADGYLQVHAPSFIPDLSEKLENLLSNWEILTSSHFTIRVEAPPPPEGEFPPRHAYPGGVAAWYTGRSVAVVSTLIELLPKGRAKLRAELGISSTTPVLWRKFGTRPFIHTKVTARVGRAVCRGAVCHADIDVDVLWSETLCYSLNLHPENCDGVAAPLHPYEVETHLSRVTEWWKLLSKAIKRKKSMFERLPWYEKIDDDWVKAMDILSFWEHLAEKGAWRVVHAEP
ncbi:MAG: hypothetical protein QXQ90_07855 [Desulfurococcaceae archaeon]